MNEIFVSSDLHIGHNKEFIYKPRGFETVDDMNTALIDNINARVKRNDVFYILGDVIMGQADQSMKLIRAINCQKINIIIGNHDTTNKIKMYTDAPNIKSVLYADMLTIGKKHFFLSHYPTMTGNVEFPPKVANLFGHTHQETNFYLGNPYMYHVGVDSHNNMPVHIDEIMADIKKYKDEVFGGKNNGAEI